MVDKTQLITASEYLQKPVSAEVLQLIHGEVIMSPASELRHQEIVGKLFLLLTNLVIEGKVYFAPVDVRLDEHNVVQPDVMWLAANSQCQSVDGKYLQGAPELVVEVFSPGSIRLDRREKYALYEQYGGHEYWMIDPFENYVEVVFHQDRKFIQLGIFAENETFQSSLLQQNITLAELF